MKPFLFEANSYILDLVNTLQVDANGPLDLLVAPKDAVDWVRAHASTNGLKVPKLGVDLDAADLLAQIRELRTAGREASLYMMEGQPPAPRHLRSLNRILEAAPVVSAVVRDSHGGLSQVRRPDTGSIEAILHPIAESFADLITDLDWTRIHTCNDDGCILFFYDVSKNRSRRWCSMDRCGNRAKVSAHYQRSKSK